MAVQAIEFARRLAPEPRRVIKHALRNLRLEQGDIRGRLISILGHGLSSAISGQLLRLLGEHMVSNGIPSVVNSDQQQEQRRRSDAKQ
jgi:hypothetical protein